MLDSQCFITLSPNNTISGTLKLKSGPCCTWLRVPRSYASMKIRFETCDLGFEIPGYKFITALCPNLKPTWSEYRCQGSDRLDTVYSQASYRRDAVYSNSKGSEPGSPSYCRRKSFSEVQFQSLGVANSGNRPIQETRQWRH